MLTQASVPPLNLWVVTDLDGTLLDHHYCWDAAKPTLAWLKQLGIPVIPCTSKTAEEVRQFCVDANLEGPFIVENGGAVHGGSADNSWEHGLGAPHGQLRQQLNTLSERMGEALVALEDLAAEQVMELTGLALDAVGPAQRRRWSVPFLNPPESLRQSLETHATALGLTVVQGNRMSHLLQGGTGKGQAIASLKTLLHQPNVEVLALGDSPNDASLLNAGDISVVVPGPRGPHPHFATAIAEGRFALAPAPHASGWACSVLTAVKARVSAELAATAPEPPLDWP